VAAAGFQRAFAGKNQPPKWRLQPRLAAPQERMKQRGLAIYSTCALAFLHAPLLILIVFSFNSSRFTVWEGFSLRWYQAAMNDPQLADGLVNSVIIAIVAGIVSTLIGTLAAYGMWRRRAPILYGALYLSLVTPEIVTGVSLLALFQWLFRFLHLRLGLYTVVIAHVAFSIAYVAIVVSARLRTYDRTLEEAAMDLGASEWRAFWRVTLPSIAPAVAAAGLLALVVSFDDYVITSLVAGVDSTTLPMVIYAMARRGVSPVVNAVSALIVVAFGVIIVVSQRLAER
jgi:spermidine/putrescine transport system permease protein